jgi:hypothetical protein
MDLFKEKMLKKNPKISQNSIKTYYSLIKNFHQRLFNSTDIQYDNFEKTKEIIQYLNQITSASKKTILSALWSLTKNSIFQKAMLEGIKAHESEMSTNVKNSKQIHNWIEPNELKSIVLENETTFNNLAKNKMTNKQSINAQDFIILVLTTGLYFPPRRSLDWINTKTQNFDKNTENYIDFRKKEIVFNIYKGSRSKGLQKIELLPSVSKILKLYLKNRSFQSNYLLTDTKGQNLSNVQLTQYLNRIFKKNVSTSMLRHFYVSNKFKNMLDLQETADAMGSSVNMITNDYMKK